MKDKYLICLEIDNTLLDRSYRATSPTISSVIGQLAAEGHCFILNSNRALEDLIATAKIFDLPGPFIGENGTFIHFPDSGQTNVLVEDEIVEQIEKLKSALPVLVEKNFPDAVFRVGDTTDINKHLDLQEIPNGASCLFFMNEFRKYTISVHAKRIEDGVLIKDVGLAECLWRAARKYIDQNKMLLKPTYTDSYANVLVCPITANKTTAYHYLAQKFPEHLRIFIADDAEDKPVSAGDYLFVVNNATNEAKNIANYISSESITKGVEDILLKIDSLI